MIVTIPSREQHEGYYSMTIEISDNCPVCGGKRGETFETLSFDGSRRLGVSGWHNPCGHIDLYSKVREEYFNSIKKEPDVQVCDATKA